MFICVSCAFSWAFSSVHLTYLFCLFLFYLLSFYYCFSDACLFSKEKQKGMDLDGNRDEEETGEVGGDCNQNILFKKYLFSV